jgi:hypothetical protein
VSATQRTLAALAFAASLLACQGGSSPAVGREVAPALAVQTTRGAVYDPSVLAGKLGLVNFWSPG